MAVDYTFTELNKRVKQRASVPTSQNLVTDERMALFLADELETVVVPMMVSMRSDFFITFEDTPITSSTVATNNYPINKRAIGQMIKDVRFIDAQGVETPLFQVGADEYQYGCNNDGFYIEGDNIRLKPANQVGETLRVYYLRRPNRIVQTNRSGKITAIDTNTNVVTLDTAVSGWTTSTLFDVIQGTPGFQSRGDDLTITAISGADLTFTTLPADMIVGDYVAEAGESPIAQVPYEAFSLLTQLGAAKILEAKGDKAGWQVALNKAEALELHLRKILSPRVQDKSKKVVSRRGLWRSGGW